MSDFKQADLMVVAEVATLSDDLDDAPMSGIKGRFLKNALEELGFKSVYFTCAVKCRTPEGRPPTKDEIKACLPYLEAEVEAVRPKAILALGNGALYATTGRSGIGNYRGHELEGFRGIPLVATYSPSAVLRSPKLMTTFKADLYRLSCIMDGTKTDKYNAVIHHVMNKDSFRDLLRHLELNKNNENGYGAVDLETATFDYWRPETHVMTMAICVDGLNSWAIPLEHSQSPWRGQSEKIIGYLAPYLKHYKMVGNNWKYDNKWMRKKYKVTVNFGPDNMLISYVNDENIPHGLKFQAAIHCEAPEYDKDINWPAEFDPAVGTIKAKVAEYDRMPLLKMLTYNAYDAFYSWHVYPQEKALLIKDNRLARIYKHLYEKGSWVFMRIEEEGMWVDPDRLAQATVECDRKLEEVVTTLNNMIPAGWVDKHLNKKQLKAGFNWNSTKQLGELFFGEDGFNFPVVAYTASGKPGTAESVLIELNSEVDHPALNALMDYRKWAKYKNTYLIPWAQKSYLDHRLHPTYKLHGTVTGRLSGEDGVHQVPRDKFIRGLIGAPPGWSFFEIDGSQIELRVVAIVAHEQTMLRIFATGGDIHRETAATVMGKDPKDVTSDERKKAKAVNFGFVYGMGWKKFKIYAWEKYGVRLTDSEAKLYRQRFFEKYPDLPAWHARMRKLVRSMGYVVSPIGRRRRLPDIYSIDEGMQAAAEREAINSPVQGFGSDYVLAGFIEMVMDYIEKEDPDFKTIRPVGAVHDAQYYEIRNDMLDYWPNKIKTVFDDPSRLKRWFGYTPTVAITGDCKIGNHWGDAKDWAPGQPLPFEPR